MIFAQLNQVRDILMLVRHQPADITRWGGLRAQTDHRVLPSQSHEDEGEGGGAGHERRRMSMFPFYPSPLTVDVGARAVLAP